MWSTAIRPVLTYGLNTVNVDKTRLKELESIQGKLVTSMVSLHKYCRSTPLLKAMKIPSVESLLDVSNIELLRHVLTNDSRARSFYFHCLNIVVCDRSSSRKGLLNRVKNICVKYDINFVRYICDPMYSSQIKRVMKLSSLYNDGYSDSVRVLLLSHDPYDKYVLNMLLAPFN